MVDRVLGFDEALALVLREAAAVAKPPSQRVELLGSRGRILSQAVRADRDHPPFDRATRDGFALRTGDLVRGRPLPVMGSLRAGEAWQSGTIECGTAIEIMTGAPLPQGADAVVMVEHVSQADGGIQMAAQRVLQAGDNIVPQGAEARRGDVLIPPGVELGAAEIALAAACGADTLEVYEQPTVAIVATGDELVEIGDVPGSGQIRNSNSYGIAALVEAAGGRSHRLPIARDLRTDLWDRISAGRAADLLVFSGGVSMGKYDLVEDVLAEFGAEFFFTGVHMQPGKPVVFGCLPERRTGSGSGPARFFFGLPGNPVSTQVTFQCFAKPLLQAMGGAEVRGPTFVLATLAEETAGKPGLMRLLPARLVTERSHPEVRPVPWQGSGDMAANARANCYVVLPPRIERFRPGEVVSVLLR